MSSWCGGCLHGTYPRTERARCLTAFEQSSQPKLGESPRVVQGSVRPASLHWNSDNNGTLAMLGVHAEELTSCQALAIVRLGLSLPREARPDLCIR